jgi:hypothetical protein
LYVRAFVSVLRAVILSEGAFSAEPKDPDDLHPTPTAHTVLPPTSSTYLKTRANPAHFKKCRPTQLIFSHFNPPTYNHTQNSLIPPKNI